MKILQRYVLRELILPFVLCLATLNFIFMGGYLARAAQFIIGRGVPLADTLYILLLALPEMMSFTVPTSALMAVLIVFGNFSQNNEIRAAKASGIHPLHLMAPAFLVGLGLSLVMFIFNDQIAPNTSFELRRATKQVMIRNPKALIEPGRFIELSGNIKFLAKELKGDEMRDIFAYQVEDDDKPVRDIIAERGEIISHPDRNEIQIRLYHGTVSDSKDANVQSIQFETYEFPTLGQQDIRTMKKKMRDLTLAELLVRLGRRENVRGDFLEIWSAFHQRIAFAWGSFIFIFLGIPVAILVHRGEIVLSFGIAMAAAGLYYILFVGAKTVAVQGLLPAYLAFWIPNLLLLGIGARLLKLSLLR